MYHDGKEGAVTGPLSPLPHTVVLLLPDIGQYRYVHMHLCHKSVGFIVKAFCAFLQFNRGNDAKFSSQTKYLLPEEVFLG